MKRRVIELLLIISFLFIGATVSSGKIQMTDTNIDNNPQIESVNSILGDNNKLQPGTYSSGIVFDQSTTLLAGSYQFSGPLIIPIGVTVIGEPGEIHIQASDILIDGAYVCTTFTGGGSGGNSGQNGQTGSGTGGGSGGVFDGGGGGGAGYGTNGFDGTAGASQGGGKGVSFGFTGLAPGNIVPSISDIQGGSVGGGGAGGDGVIGGNGGAGGGSVFFESTSSVIVTGSISCNGDNGQNGDDDASNASGGGGGGSGGGVLIYGGDVTINGAINALGGLGGIAGSTTLFGNDGGAGGNGGLGRVKIFYQNSYSKTVTPTGVLHEEHLSIPSVSLKVPHFGQLYQANENIELNITNSNGSYQYTWDGDAFTNVSDSFIPTTPSTDGPHDLHVDIYSSSQHLVQQTYSIFVDGTIPELSTSSGLSIEYEEGTLGNQLFFTMNDINPGLFNLTLDGTFIFENSAWANGTISGTYDGLSVGLHTVQIEVSDIVWNSAVLWVSINVTAVPVDTPTTTEPITTSNSLLDTTSDLTSEETTSTTTPSSSEPPSSIDFPFVSLLGFSILIIFIKRKFK